MTQTVWLNGEYQKRLAHHLIDNAPLGAIVKISPAERTISQNDKMWVMISDISRHKPDGRAHVPEVWKAIFMSACGHEVQFEHGLDGQPFPIGFRSSKLTKGQMSDLIEFITAYGTQHSVKWSKDYE